MLSDVQGKILLQYAREVLQEKFGESSAEKPENSDFAVERATFVTLKIAGQLRGCIGSLVPSEPLVDSVGTNVVNAAFHDHRFSALTREELETVTLEISILTPTQLLSFDDKEDLFDRIRPGIDGVVLRCGEKGATFLPQVWKQLPDPKTFFSRLCDKAGLADDCWQHDGLIVEVYQVQSFTEEKA